MAAEESPISMIETIKKRTSIRSYKEEALATDLKERIRSSFKEDRGPFGGRVRYELIVKDLAKKDSDLKLGTYGVIKGAASFVVAVIQEGEHDLEDFGYVFEKFILNATALGLGTCWLGGTYTKGEFSKAIAQKEQEILPCITPLGYPAQKRSLVETAMRLAAGSKTRKPWREIFFKEDFEQPLSEDEAREYATPLEMVRLAPSASNKQPWRIVRDQGQFHFYLQHTKGYGKMLGFDIQRVDLGIAMCHFELAAQELGLKGQWVVEHSRLHNVNLKLPEDTNYIVSWV